MIFHIIMVLHIQVKWHAIIKVLIAIALGSVIGLERELANKPAGLRTHMLVAGTTTLFMVLGEFLIQYFVNTSLPANSFNGDPIRIMQAIITGISFLGAGTIFVKQEDQLEGLTTAASILFVTAIGMAVAIDKIAIGVILTVLVVAILFIVGTIENWLKGVFADKENSEAEE